MSESLWDDPRITAYVLGELTEEELATFENEMASNSEMAAAVEEARSVTGQLEGLYADEPTATLEEERREAILSGDSPLVTPATPETGSWRVPAIAMAMAAVLLLMVGVAPLVWQQTQEQTVTQRDESVQVEAVLDEARALRSEVASERERVDPVLSLETELAASDAVDPPTDHFAAIPMIDDAGSTPTPFAESKELAEVDAEEAMLGAAISPTPVPNVPMSLPDLSAPAAPEASAPKGLSVGRSAQLSAEPQSQPSRAPATRRMRSDYAQSEAKAKPEEESLNRSNTRGIANAPTGGVQVDRLSELDTVILRGNKVDLERARAMLQQQQQAQRRVVEQALREAEANQVARQGGQLPTPRPAAIAPGESQPKPRAASLDHLADGASPSPFGAAPEHLGDFGGKLRGGQQAPAEPMIRGQIIAGGAIAKNEELLKQLRGRAKAKDAAAHPFGEAVDEGRGPGIAGDRFDPITDNPFKRVDEHPLSTFSVDVDTASYSKTRDFLMRANQLPRPDAVRIEELVNYFEYEYVPPSDGDDHPFAARATVTACPWNGEHRLARIALKGKTMEPDERPQCNLVFLLDTSGSMNASNKLPLVIEGMKMLIKQLDKQDRVAITVYAGSAGLVLDSTPAKKKKRIEKALTQLSAGGSTNGGAGIALAYQTARENFLPEGVNRVILCTDGDFNVGTTGTDELVRMVEKEAKGGVFLSVLGFGMGNHNDAMLERISGRGNGNYAFIDNRDEARKVLVDQTNATLVTIAKDVKLQVEFNPNQVSSYRLIGYENRVLAKEDFNNDKVDAGEIGAGHAVTALYEIVPADVESAVADNPKVDDLKYQTKSEPSEAAERDEMLTLKLRYKEPDGAISTLVKFPVSDNGGAFKDADDDVRFAAAVASFGMQLRRSEYAGTWTMSDVIDTAGRAKGKDLNGLRAEFIELAQKASELMGEE